MRHPTDFPLGLPPNQTRPCAYVERASSPFADLLAPPLDVTYPLCFDTPCPWKARFRSPPTTSTNSMLCSDCYCSFSASGFVFISVTQPTIFCSRRSSNKRHLRRFRIPRKRRKPKSRSCKEKLRLLSKIGLSIRERSAHSVASR